MMTGDDIKTLGSNLSLDRMEKLKLRLSELQEDRAAIRKARLDILSGKAQSYGIGTRNKSAYGMTLSELNAWLKSIEKEIEEIEAELDCRGARAAQAVVPTDW